MFPSSPSLPSKANEANVWDIVVSRYPPQDHGDFAFPQKIEAFALTPVRREGEGVTGNLKGPLPFLFVLTDEKGDRVYVSSILFPESKAVPEGQGIISFAVLSHYSFFSSFSALLMQVFNQWTTLGQQGDSATEVRPCKYIQP